MERGHRQYQHRIVSDPEILAGKPVVRGTRIPVALVLAYLANNPDFDEFFADYPELTLDDVQACLAYGQALAAGKARASLPTAAPDFRSAPHLPMRFLADQNLERRVAVTLQAQGHDVTVGVVDYPATLSDTDLLALAQREGRILPTNEPDFGELIARWGHPHAGVIVFRMKAASAQHKVERLAEVLRDEAEHLDRLIVVTERRIRVHPEQS